MHLCDMSGSWATDMFGAGIPLEKRRAWFEAFLSRIRKTSWWKPEYETIGPDTAFSTHETWYFPLVNVPSDANISLEDLEDATEEAEEKTGVFLW